MVLKFSDFEGATVDPQAAKVAAAKQPKPKPEPVEESMPAMPVFVPIVGPPSDHHPLNTGLGTEHGDSAKTLVEKVNKGFANIIELLQNSGQAVVAKVEGAFDGDTALDAIRDWVVKTFTSVTDHQALADEVANLKSDLAATPATSEAVPTVPKEEFDALKTAHDELEARFEKLGTRLEAFLGIAK